MCVIGFDDRKNTCHTQFYCGGSGGGLYLSDSCVITICCYHICFSNPHRTACSFHLNWEMWILIQGSQSNPSLDDSRPIAKNAGVILQEHLASPPGQIGSDTHSHSAAGDLGVQVTDNGGAFCFCTRPISTSSFTPHQAVDRLTV